MTTGELLFTAAASCGLYGVMTKSYGPQIRGGESACFVRLGHRQFEKQSDEIDFMVVLDWRNVDRFREELYLSPEAWILYEKAEGDVRPEFLQTKNNIPVGLKELASKIEGGKGRPNICALGVLCYLLGIKETAGLRSIEERFGPMGKAGLEENTRSLQAGQDWARQEWKSRPFQLSIEDDVSNRWALTGNQGIVVGSLVAGCDFYAGYPITPATTIMEDLGHYLPQRGGVMIQAEDELAAINMAIGASFGGKKALTATSGPGFSLMAEGLSLAVMAEIPLVVVDVQRAGPSTGIATKTEQSDLWAALASSHGDNPRVVLAPSSVQDCIEMTVKAFNIAEMYQVPVILLSDQFLAGRTEILDPISLETFEVRRRQLPAELEATTYHRFGSSVGTVAPMAIPGMIGGEYTAEGLEHDALGWPNTSHKIHQVQGRGLDRSVRKTSWQSGYHRMGINGRCGEGGYSDGPGRRAFGKRDHPASAFSSSNRFVEPDFRRIRGPLCRRTVIDGTVRQLPSGFLYASSNRDPGFSRRRDAAPHIRAAARAGTAWLTMPRRQKWSEP
jgi:2-oxoglutarate ferredoxin oxidoreductase subunit alpha